MSDVYELLAQQAEQQTRLAEKLANELDAMQAIEALDDEEQQLLARLEDVRRRKAAREEKAKEVRRAQLVVQRLGALPAEVRQAVDAAQAPPAQSLAESGIPSAWTPAPAAPPAPSGSGAYPVVPPPAPAAPGGDGPPPGQVVATGGPGLTQPHTPDDAPAAQTGPRHKRGRK